MLAKCLARIDIADAFHRKRVNVDACHIHSLT
jgi:hypothetical protein